MALSTRQQADLAKVQNSLEQVQQTSHAYLTGVFQALSNCYEELAIFRTLEEHIVAQDMTEEILVSLMSDLQALRQAHQLAMAQPN